MRRERKEGEDEGKTGKQKNELLVQNTVELRYNVFDRSVKLNAFYPRHVMSNTVKL